MSSCSVSTDVAMSEPGIWLATREIALIVWQSGCILLNESFYCWVVTLVRSDFPHSQPQLRTPAAKHTTLQLTDDEYETGDTCDTGNTGDTDDDDDQ